MSVYENLYQSLDTIDIRVDKFIYVDTIPRLCYDRMVSRARDGEAKITLQYLESCHRLHQEMMGALDEERVIRFSGDLSESYHEEEVVKLVKKICSLL